MEINESRRSISTLTGGSVTKRTERFWVVDSFFRDRHPSLRYELVGITEVSWIPMHDVGRRRDKDTTRYEDS